jgi:hypothetical protein
MRKAWMCAGVATVAVVVLLLLGTAEGRSAAPQQATGGDKPAPAQSSAQSSGGAQPGAAAHDQGTAGKSSTSKTGGKSAASEQQKAADLLEDKIRAAWKAFRDKDKKAYAEFLADDLMAVEEDGGGERTKTKVLREVDDSVVQDFKLQLFRVDAIAPGAQLVTYENFIQFPVKARPRFEKIFVSEIWLKRGGEWKMWRYQATKVK